VGEVNRGVHLFIGSLKDEVAVMNLGATILAGLSKDVAIPRMTAGTSAQWIAEGEAPDESVPAFDTVPLAFKQLSATVRFSRKMAIQADPSFEELMRNDIRQEIAIGLDRAAIAGTGLGDQPTGIINTSGVGLVELGENGGALTWPKVLEFTEKVEFANAAVGSLAFLTNAKVKSMMMQTPRVAGHPSFILDDQGESRTAGYLAGLSNIVPANLTKGTGTNLSAMIFGNWRDLLIGEFGGMDLIVDPYTESAKGNIRVAVHSYWDIAVRHARSFAVARDIATG
jgi:HK97 family phage major capsid protein